MKIVLLQLRQAISGPYMIIVSTSPIYCPHNNWDVKGHNINNRMINPPQIDNKIITIVHTFLVLYKMFP